MMQDALAELIQELKVNSPEIYQALLKELHLTDKEVESEVN